MMEKPPCSQCGIKPQNCKNLCKSCYWKLFWSVKKNDILWREKRKKHVNERYRIQRGLDPNTPRMKAPAGSGYMHYEGYKYITKKGHPNQHTKRGGIYEHTFVMSEFLGRPLLKHEQVHHKNGVRDDNRIENLELWSKSQPNGQKVEDKINWCKEFLETYGYTITKTDS